MCVSKFLSDCKPLSAACWRLACNASHIGAAYGQHAQGVDIENFATLQENVERMA
jgi:hypothetical protein